MDDENWLILSRLHYFISKFEYDWVLERYSSSHFHKDEKQLLLSIDISIYVEENKNSIKKCGIETYDEWLSDRRR